MHMLFNFRYSFIFLVVFLYGALQAQNPLLSVDIKATEQESDSLEILCSIMNQSKDTLIVLSSPFLIEGESSHSRRLHPWPGTMYTANALLRTKWIHFQLLG